MATTAWTWEYGGEGTGLHFTITYDIATEKFTVTSLEGSFDLNALWWDNGADDNIDISLAKSDSSLNMNGSGADDWDGYMKVSNAGLGTLGVNKDSFISAGETDTFSLADFGLTGTFNPEDGGTLGVRATSVNGSGSIKLVDTEPVPTDDTQPEHFPDNGHELSFAVFYFGTTSGDVKGGGTGGNTPDGVYTVKVEFPDGVGNDLDDYYADILAHIIATDPNVDANTPVLGVAIHAGEGKPEEEVDFYAIDGDEDADLLPTPPGDLALGNEVDTTIQFDEVFA